MGTMKVNSAKFFAKWLKKASTETQFWPREIFGQNEIKVLFTMRYNVLNEFFKTFVTTDQNCRNF
jgi:hypothetical protein